MEPGIGLSPTEKSRMTHQKCSAAILVADVGEAPDIAEPDRQAQRGEEIFIVVTLHITVNCSSAPARPPPVLLISTHLTHGGRTGPDN